MDIRSFRTNWSVTPTASATHTATPAAARVACRWFCSSTSAETYSYLLAGLIPLAEVKIYPDAAHGFLFQHHTEFAADLSAFLTGAS